MKNETANGVIALLVVAAIAFLVIGGSGILTEERWYNIKAEEGNTGDKDNTENMENAENTENTGNGNTDISSEKLDIPEGAGIQEALRYHSDSGETQGYLVTAVADGYGGPVTMNVEFDASGAEVLGMHILEHMETEGVGSKITEAEFGKQFVGINTPVLLAQETSGLMLQDGVYEAQAEQEQDGYTDRMTMTVENGRIIEASWDEVDAQGVGKRHLSEIGEYQMTEEGLTWSEQANALSAALAEHQNLEFLDYDEAGKTDAVSGVSISVNGFVHMAEECLKQAGAGGSILDGISGATISSKAVVKGVNSAAEYLREVRA